MSTSTSSSCMDVDQATPVVVEWEWNDAIHYLSKPDPKIDDIILRIRYCDEVSSALFELRFPVNLKGVDGVSDIFIPIPTSSIISLNLTTAATAPDVVQRKFDCATLRVGFQLNRALNILVPIAAKEPLSPSRAQSGKVLDAVRMLGEVTCFDVYIDATKLSKAKLQSMCDAVAQARLKPFRDQHDLASMYHGTGAKVVDLFTQAKDAPPSYHETGPPPPMPPINEKKRQRIESQDEPTSQIALIWAELRATQEQNQQLQLRVAALEKENQDLKQEVEQLQTDDRFTADILEELDSRSLELQDEHEGLGDRVDFIKEHLDSNTADSFIERVTNRVLDDISTRLSRN